MISAAGLAMVNHARLLRAAGVIGEEMGRRVVRCRDGSLAWLAPATSTGAPFTTLGPYLYSGCIGSALFLAALVRVSGAPGPRSLCLDSIAPLRHRLSRLVADPEHPSRMRLGLGGLTGLGSVLYAFVRIGEWLNEPNLLQEARDLVSLITPELIERDERFDVTDGCAGTILALLTLMGQETEPVRRLSTIEIASGCARHLLDHRESRGGGPRAWAPPGRLPLTGFAHGAGGIAYALLQLYNHTGQAELREAAEEGMDYERTLYDPERCNWRDLRFDQPQYQCSWCHGAPGLALSRVAMVGLLDRNTLQEEMEIAIETTRSLPDTQIDHLCCGNLGRADILHTAGWILGDSALVKHAALLAGRIVDRAEREGHFRLTHPSEPYQFDPSFFRGVSGIGFALLRLAHTELLPSPLHLG